MAFLGVDFGTTNSSMAGWSASARRAQVLLDAEGQDKTPSVVFFGETERLVGTKAVNRLTDADNSVDVQQRTVQSIKRQLLEPPVIALTERLTVTPTEVVALVLGKLKRDAESLHQSGSIDSAVLTYPAVFDRRHTDVIMAAATMAGFQELQLLEEPVAAAMAYESDMAIDDERPTRRGILVYDYGGGTFDAAFVARDEGARKFYRALEPDGDDRCGGDDIDQALYDYFNKEAIQKLGRSISGEDGRIDQAFLRRCRRYKENLSNGRQVPFSAILPGGSRLMSTIERETFEGIIEPQVMHTVEITQRMFQRAQDKGFKVDTVLLVGGSSQIPLVQRRIAEVLGIRPHPWGHRDVAVALGAAIHGSDLWPTASSKAGPMTVPKGTLNAGTVQKEATPPAPSKTLNSGPSERTAELGIASTDQQPQARHGSKPDHGRKSNPSSSNTSRALDSIVMWIVALVVISILASVIMTALSAL